MAGLLENKLSQLPTKLKLTLSLEISWLYISGKNGSVFKTIPDKKRKESISIRRTGLDGGAMTPHIRQP